MKHILVTKIHDLKIHHVGRFLFSGKHVCYFLLWVKTDGGLSFLKTQGLVAVVRARGSGGFDIKCYEYGQPGHFAHECRLRTGFGGLDSE